MTILCTWEAEGVFRPRPAFAKRASQEYVVGDMYCLDIREERSEKSHRYYFASIREAWMNLPEQLAEQFPSAEHLRKWCLIKAGYRDEKHIATASREEALHTCAVVEGLDEFAMVVPHGNIVTIYTAKSQSRKDMNKREFARSKQAVLGILSQIVEVEQRTLEREAAQNRYEDAA